MHDPYTLVFAVRRPWPRHYYNSTDATRHNWWPPMVNVWHVEPRGHDAGTVCRTEPWWRLHVWHWRLQVHHLALLKAWLWTRCERCGGRFGWGESGFVSQFDHDGPGWFRGERGVRHGVCDRAPVLPTTLIYVEKPDEQ